MNLFDEFFNQATISWASLVCGLAGFLVGLILHIVHWRWNRPPDDLTWLFRWVFVVSIASSALIFAIWRQEHAGWACSALWDLSVAIGFSGVLAVLYIILYPGAQAASPSMLILLLLARRGSEGMLKKELEDLLTDEVLQHDSLENLQHEQFVESREGRLFIGPRGRKLLNIGRFHRSLVGLTKGQG